MRQLISKSMSRLEAAVSDLAGPLARTQGIDVVEVQFKGAGRRSLLRVLVDRKGGVDLAACQDFSRRLSASLDAAEASGDGLRLPEGYRLEVSSPGIDHPLRDRAAFDRVEGRSVRVVRRREDEVEELDGLVRAAEDDAVLLETDSGQVRVAYSEIKKATQRLPW